MTSLWPFLAATGLGALHGLNPANGWAFVTAMGLRERDAAKARHALLPLALGQVASVIIAAAILKLGTIPDGRFYKAVALTVLAAGAAHCLVPRTAARAPGIEASHCGLLIWSFLMGSIHGAGLMLLPALGPMCSTGGAGLPGLLATTMVAMHLAAMLATTALAADYARKRLAPRAHLWPAMLAVTGAALMAPG